MEKESWIIINVAIYLVIHPSFNRSCTLRYVQVLAFDTCTQHLRHSHLSTYAIERTSQLATIKEMNDVLYGGLAHLRIYDANGYAMHTFKF